MLVSSMVHGEPLLRSDDTVQRFHENGDVDVADIDLPHDRSAELCGVGPEDGDVVLYFHSPATSGEELGDAIDAAAQLRLRVLCVKRPSIDCAEADRFVGRVADDVTTIVDALGLDALTVLGWSGGAPFALAAAARLGAEVTSIHLVSPIPGPLTGPEAVPGRTERLRQVATTTASSTWISGRAALRDYQAVGAPWTFDVESLAQPITIWSPTDDEIVPPRLIDHLRQRLVHAEVVPVPGRHDWLTENWHTVLPRVLR